jgi:hypothetical protein
MCAVDFMTTGGYSCARTQLDNDDMVWCLCQCMVSYCERTACLGFALVRHHVWCGSAAALSKAASICSYEVTGHLALCVHLFVCRTATGRVVCFGRSRGPAVFLQVLSASYHGCVLPWHDVSTQIPSRRKKLPQLHGWSWASTMMGLHLLSDMQRRKVVPPCSQLLATCLVLLQRGCVDGDAGRWVDGPTCVMEACV